MLVLGPIGFTAPWLLLGLFALPILWLLLRAVPPAPIRLRFPGVALLIGLSDDDQQSDRTPWWLLLLRALAVAALILGFAGPVLDPEPRRTGTGPLLVLVDGTWADAADWTRRIDRAEEALDEAAEANRPVALVRLTDRPEGPLPFRAARSWSAGLAGEMPAPWAPTGAAEWVAGLDGEFDTIWLSDGLAYDWREPVLEALEARGEVRVLESPRPIYALRPPAYRDGTIAIEVLRAVGAGDETVGVEAYGPDPNGAERRLAAVEVAFADGETVGTAELSLPPELRNRVTRFEIAGIRSAGATSLTDDSLRRREVALISGVEDREGLQLLAPEHYLEQALTPVADLLDGDLSDVLLANPDVIILSDVARIPGGQEGALRDWIEAGGLLIRFAGPRLAASDIGRNAEHPLMPVRLRAGGRSVGGAMSWGEPKALRAFAPTSPFSGLAIPEDVAVNAQVLAQPDPALSERTIASLADGTPLVTRKRAGAGQVVLFHVTANAEWSTLPLSGLFVSMLERLAVSTRPQMPDAEDLTGTTWTIDSRIDAFGQVEEAGTLPGVAGEALAEAEPGPATPPGLYAGEERRIALNVIDRETVLSPAVWPSDMAVEGLDVRSQTPLGGPLLSLGVGLLILDVLAALWLAGRLLPARGVAAAITVLAALSPVGGADAQDRTERFAETDAEFALAATDAVVLAHVLTGDAEVDRIAAAGLEGLSRTLYQRTSVEPDPPVGIELGTDELAFFPMLYWPVTADQPIPSDAAYAKLNDYLRSGGLIVFDTRDADVAGTGRATPAGLKLQDLARPLDIPPLQPMPDDHVLTRTFYLLQDFPGRYSEGTLWVEAAPPDAVAVEGMPFRDLNDNVTPVIIGGNDWASAWAVDEAGSSMFPVGSGYAGERQREIALRFGVNLVMHVLTGNYKSDQVHVPALLDRLGN